MTGTLILVRHGQSEWNLKNLFTGWRNPDLTEKGIEEARARRPGRSRPRVRCRTVCFTSALKRAQHTLDLILEEMGITRRHHHPQPTPSTSATTATSRASTRTMRAPEMGRGAGADLAPLLRRAAAGRRVAQGHRGPDAALLRAPRSCRCVKAGKTVLVAAHGNSLRSIVMAIEELTPEQILKRELATGEPMVYDRQDGSCGEVGSKPLRGTLSPRGEGLVHESLPLRRGGAAPDEGQHALRPHHPRLPAQDRPLPRHAPVVAGQRAAVPPRGGRARRS